MFKKMAFGSVGLLLLISPLFASAQTLGDLVAQLQAALVQLQLATGPGAVLGATTQDASTPFCPNLTDNLSYGTCDESIDSDLEVLCRNHVSGTQVVDLQHFLTDLYHPSSDIMIGFFGNKTKNLVIRFQSEHDLPATGLVGPMTRAAIHNVCNTVPTPTVTSKSTEDATPGTVVIIYGTGFTDTNDVLLDGVVQRTTGSLEAGTKLLFVVPTNYPTGTANHKLTIRNQNGTSNETDIRVRP